MKKGWRRRVVRWFATGLVAAFLATALPVVAMRWMDPWYSAFMLDAALDASRQGKAKYQTDYRWVDLEQISPHAAVAVIASEDQLFPYHTGFDFKSIREAIRANERQAARKRPRLRGGSTITQQVAKNLFLWPGRSVVRKALELPLALWIDLVLGKQRVLEIYLNIAELGPSGQFGVEAGAQYAFGRSAATLSPREAALLASILPNPVRRSARNPGPGVRRLAATYAARAQAQALQRCWSENRGS